MFELETDEDFAEMEKWRAFADAIRNKHPRPTIWQRVRGALTRKGSR